MIVSDILTDIDLLALEERLDDDFGEQWAAHVAEKRRIAVGWIERRLRASGLNPTRHLARRVPSAAYATVGGAFSDLTTALGDPSANDVRLSSVFVSPAGDALYVGLDQPMRALYVSMLDSVNTHSLSASSFTYWNGGAWAGLSSLADGTIRTSSVAFSGGGAVTFRQPEDWQPRVLHPTHANTVAYWLRVQMSSTPATGAAVSQMLPVQPSVLTVPAAFYALALLYRESSVGNRGGWSEKADKLFKDAADELEISLRQVASEFDNDQSQAVDTVEVNSPPSPATTAWLTTWERG